MARTTLKLRTEAEIIEARWQFAPGEAERIGVPYWVVLLERGLGRFAETEVRLSAIELVAVIHEALGKEMNHAEISRLCSGLLAVDALEKASRNATETTESETIRLLKQIQKKLDGPLPATAPAAKWMPSEDFGKAVKRSTWTVRSYCRDGLVRCKKADDLNPKSDWLIEVTEVQRFLDEGTFREVVQPPAETQPKKKAKAKP